MSEALRLAELIERDYHDETLAPRMAATELRRLVAENEALREANEAFGKRQEWWNEKMVALEAINAELVEALRWIDKRCPSIMLEQPLHKVHAESAYDAGGRARAALAKVEASNGS